MDAEYNVDLDGLSDVEATIPFTEDLSKTLRTFFNNAWDHDSLGDHTVLITGFPIESFSIDDEEPPPYPSSCKALYLTDSKILVLTKPGLPHIEVTLLFSRRLDSKLFDMNCEEENVPSGRATRSIGNVKIEPDASWEPFRTNYPTCVLESAFSESNGALGRNSKIWLEHNDSHVTQVITVQVYRNRPEIVFTVWKKGEEQREPRAVVDQEVYIKLEEGRPTASGELCLSFEKLFERPPRPGTAESDFVFSARELGGIARIVWKEMGFIDVRASVGSS